MTICIGLNGFGRIGRSVFRAALNDPLFSDLEVVAINDPAPREALVHLLKYDSIMGPLRPSVEETPGGFRLEGREISLTREKGPGEVPWKESGVDVVIGRQDKALLNGATLDYVELEPGAFQFIFLNPNDPHFEPPRE